MEEYIARVNNKVGLQFGTQSNKVETFTHTQKPCKNYDLSLLKLLSTLVSGNEIYLVNIFVTLLLYVYVNKKQVRNYILTALKFNKHYPRQYTYIKQCA